MRLLLTTLLLGLAACGGEDATDTPDPTPSLGGEVELNQLHENVAATAARDEHDAKVVTVAHILIGFQGASRSTQTRTKDEAEARTAQVLARALDGEDFDALVDEFSEDPGRGPYTMSLDGSVGFRLLRTN